MTRSESGKARWAKMSRAAKKKVLARLAKARKSRKRTKRNVSYKRAHAVSVVRLHQGKALTKHKMYKEADRYYGKALRASRYSMGRMFEKNPWSGDSRGKFFVTVRSNNGDYAAMGTLNGSFRTYQAANRYLKGLYSRGLLFGRGGYIEDQEGETLKAAEFYDRNNPPSRRAQAFISRKIPLLVHKEGYAVPRAVAAAYKMARDRGYKTNYRGIGSRGGRDPDVVFDYAQTREEAKAYAADAKEQGYKGVRIGKPRFVESRGGMYWVIFVRPYQPKKNPRKKNTRMKAIMRRAQQLIRKGKSKSEALKKAFKEAKRGRRNPTKRLVRIPRVTAALLGKKSRWVSAKDFAPVMHKMKKVYKTVSNPKSGYHKIYGRVITMKTTKGTLFPSVKTAIYGDKRNKKRLVLTGEKWTPAMAGARVLEMRAKDRNASTINGKPKRKLKSDAPSQPWRHSFGTRPKITHDKQGHIVIIGSKNLYDPKH